MTGPAVFTAQNIHPNGGSGPVSVHATKDSAQRRFSWFATRIEHGLARWEWVPGHWWTLIDDDLGRVAEVHRTLVRP